MSKVDPHLNETDCDYKAMLKLCFRDYYFTSFFILFLVGLFTLIPLALHPDLLPHSSIYCMAIYFFSLVMVCAFTLRGVQIVIKN